MKTSVLGSTTWLGNVSSTSLREEALGGMSMWLSFKFQGLLLLCEGTIIIAYPSDVIQENYFVCFEHLS